LTQPGTRDTLFLPRDRLVVNKDESWRPAGAGAPDPSASPRRRLPTLQREGTHRLQYSRDRPGDRRRRADRVRDVRLLCGTCSTSPIRSVNGSSSLRSVGGPARERSDRPRSYTARLSWNPRLPPSTVRGMRDLVARLASACTVGWGYPMG